MFYKNLIIFMFHTIFRFCTKIKLINLKLLLIGFDYDFIFTEIVK